MLVLQHGGFSDVSASHLFLPFSRVCAFVSHSLYVYLFLSFCVATLSTIRAVL